MTSSAFSLGANSPNIALLREGSTYKSDFASPQNPKYRKPTGKPVSFIPYKISATSPTSYQIDYSPSVFSKGVELSKSSGVKGPRPVTAPTVSRNEEQNKPGSSHFSNSRRAANNQNKQQYNQRRVAPAVRGHSPPRGASTLSPRCDREGGHVNINSSTNKHQSSASSHQTEGARPAFKPGGRADISVHRTRQSSRTQLTSTSVAASPASAWPGKVASCSPGHQPDANETMPDSPSNRSKSAPVLQRFSQYKTEPKYSIQGKRKIIGRDENIPAANKYDVRELVAKTSKFNSFTRPCSFSTAPRWGSSKADNVTGGPGQYNVAKSTIRKGDISFGKSKRPDITAQLGKSSDEGPGPGQYEVRGKNNKGEPTLDENTSKFAGRHGWYYENLESTRKPGPGAYSLNFGQVELPVGTETKIGSSLRPSIESHLGVNSRAPTVGPGHYKHITTLGGAKVTPYSGVPAYSFTTASYRTKSLKPRDDPEFILQATQFPQAGMTI